MANNLYRKQKRQYSTDNGVTWKDVTPPVYQVGALIEENSDCSTETGQVQYRWFTYDIADQYTCDTETHTKYNLEVLQYSYDGQIWQNTTETRKGSQTETNSCDCGYTEYKWNLIPDRYVCGTENFNKYGVEVYQIGCGTSWSNVEPYQERVTEEPIECFSTDCGMISNELEVIYVKGDYSEGSGAYDALNLNILYNEGYADNSICISGDLDADENTYIGKAEDIFPCDLWRIFFKDGTNTVCDSANTKIKRINKFIDTKYLKSYTSMFSGLDKLEYINFDSFNTENGVLFNNMFNNCVSLTDDVIQLVSNFNVSKAVSLNGMFSNCSGLTTLDLSNWNTENVCTFRNMFSGCSNLRELNIDNFDFSNMNQPFTIENKETETGTYTEFHTGGLPFMFYGLKDCNIYLRNAQYDINTFFGRGTDTCAGFSDNGGTWDIASAFNSVSNVILDMGESSTEITSFFKLVANSNDVEIINGKKVNNTENTLTCIFGGNTNENTLLINNVSKDITGNVACHIYTEDLTENLTTTYSMLSDDDKVYIDFPTTRNVTNMSYMYSYNSNTNLQTDIIDSTSNVTDMSYMFYLCNYVKKLDLSHFDLTNVTDMNHMFYGCSNLRELNISGWEIPTNTNLNNILTNCSKLERIIANNISCDTLERIKEQCNLAGINFYNVIETELTVSECDALAKPELSFMTYDDYFVYKLNNTNYTATTESYETSLSDLGITTLTSCNSTFKGNSSNYLVNLTSFPDTSNVTDMNSMFYNGLGLTSLDLSNFNTTNVTDMYDMFYCCSGLTSLDLSNFNTTNVTDMGGMFYGCGGLTSLDLSNFNMSNVINASHMFAGCSGLTSLDLSNWNTSSIEYVYNMFSNCSGLTSLDLSGLNLSNVTNMSFMFNNCKSLVTLDLSSFDPSNVTNTNKAFYNCTSLTTLRVKSGTEDFWQPLLYYSNNVTIIPI